MTLAVRLAQQTGAQCCWSGVSGCPGGGALYPELDAAVEQINAEMERLIRECPQQYLWGYARYKQPRKDRRD
jgi:KDO2-lipid IV(A) lauroyltransferase